MINITEVIKMNEKPMGKAEKAMDDVVEFMDKKATKQEQDAFLQQVLFGM